MATYLAVYLSTDARQVAMAYAAYKYHSEAGDTLTLKDVSGSDSAALDTYIGTLSATTYTAIYNYTATSGTYFLTSLHLYALRAKLIVASQGTAGSAIENATTHTTGTIGDSGETFVVNAYVGDWVVLNGGTGANQLGYIKSNTTTVLTIGNVFATTPDNTTDFAIIDGLLIYSYQAAKTGTYNYMDLAWAQFYPTHPMPYVFTVLSDDLDVVSATSTAVAATSLTDTGIGWTADDKIGMFVQIYAATTYGYQWGKITDNTTEVLTIDQWHNANDKGTPTGTPAYKIVRGAHNVFADLKVALYISTYLFDLTSSTVLTNWARLIDSTSNIDIKPSGHASNQDLDYVFDTILPDGEIIFDYTYRVS